VTNTAVSAAGSRLVVPYITSWSEEVVPRCPLVEVPDVGIGYADEIAGDRDSRGVLWDRLPWRPGVGRPVFGKGHPVRQRRAMRQLLCQICTGPADQTEDGLLFLLPDYRDEWAGWPNTMGVDEPPFCRACVPIAAGQCPLLRQGAVLVRAGRFEIAGVTGRLCAGSPVPKLVREATVYFDNPNIGWVLAEGLIRELLDCTVIELDEFDASAGVGSCPS